MLVLDSNIWVIAFAEECTEHIAVQNRITQGEERAVVSAYIYEEACDGFERSKHVTGSETEATIREFVNLIRRSEHIDDPSYEETNSIELAEVRSRRANVTLGRVLGIQPKDAPIVTLAHACAERETRRGSGESVTVVTSDRSFADLDPGAHNLPFSMQYLPYPS